MLHLCPFWHAAIVSIQDYESNYLLRLLPGYLAIHQTPRYAKMAIPLRDHNVGFNASFLLLTDNPKHLCIWYSDALEVSVFACYGLVLSTGSEVNGLTQDQYHIL